MPFNLFTQDWSACGADIGGATPPPLICIWVALHNVINAFLVLAGIVALFFIIYSGVKFITSGGDKEKVESAKKTLTFAIIGLVFILSSILVLTFISAITGVSLDTLTKLPSSNP